MNHKTLLSWAGVLGLLLPLAALAHDTTQPIANTEGGSQVVALSSGDYHTCALKADGAAECWGSNNYGQLNGTPDHNVHNGTRAGPYLSLSSGANHTCGLKADGAVECWGRNNNGQLDGTPNSNVHNGTRPGPYLSLSSGGFHTCGLKADGTAECWGHNSHGQTTPPTQNGPYLSLSSGAYHTCGLKADGTAVCWGYDYSGQATPPTPNGPYLSLSSGFVHTCGVKAAGTVDCWGAGGPGSSGDPHYGQSTVPNDLTTAGATGFGQIAAGNAHACQVKRDGTLGCWGSDEDGQATPPAGLFAQVVAGNTRSCAIGTDGMVTCWGQDGVDTTSLFGSGIWRQLAPSLGSGLCGIPTTNNLAAVCKYPGGSSHTWQGGVLGFNFRNITNQDGRVCGVSLFSAFHGDGYCYDSGLAPISGPFQRLEAGLDHQCGLKADGSLQCWGANDDGQIDNVPTGLFRTFSVGWNHACAIRDNGQLACWGSNLNGQASPPTGTYVQVAAGNTFTCAIRNDGVRVCWGDDAQGQAPQLALSPASVADGLVGTAHAGATFSLSDAGQNADGDYMPSGAAFYADPLDLPPGLSLSSAGVLSGTPTSAGSYTFSVEGEDANGFAATRTYTVTIADGTPPVIAYTLNGSTGPFANPSAWYTGDVAIAWTASDAESAITNSTGCTPSSITSDTAGATATCSATSAGGSNSLTTVSIRRDATAPTVVAAATSAPDGNNGWYRSNVTVAFSCNDALSGIASCPADQVLSTDGGAASSAAQAAIDNAGNSATSNVVTVKLDKTAPTLNPILPNPILRGQSYVANPNATDATSGVATSSCGPLDTSTLGSKSTSCTATDNAGNTNTVTLNYTVTTTCSNDGYTGMQLTWCRNICEMGYTGTQQKIWIQRWVDRYHSQPYCLAQPQPTLQ